jgi:hypothetical protein
MKSGNPLQIEAPLFELDQTDRKHRAFGIPHVCEISGNLHALPPYPAFAGENQTTIFYPISYFRSFPASIVTKSSKKSHN